MILLLRACFKVSVTQQFLHGASTPQYIIALQQVLKMSNTFLNINVPQLKYVLCNLKRIYELMLALVCSTVCFVSSRLCGLSQQQTLYLRNLWKNLSGMRSGDWGDQRTCPTMRSPKNSCSKAVVSAVWAITPWCWNHRSLTVFSNTVMN
jgi:hypothetical protein